MKHRRFILKPFPAAGLPSGIAITASAGRVAGKLSVRYELRGDVAEIDVPAAADVPLRRSRLWEATCFELFLGPRNSNRYWEFNLSPSGHWNVYRFTSYRKEMEQEEAVAALPFSVEVRPDSLTLFLDADLSAFIRGDQVVDAGISAVVRLADGTITYWALDHPGPRPDFHRRDGFILELHALSEHDE